MKRSVRLLALALVVVALPAFALANHGPVPQRTLPDMTITPETSPQTWTGTTHAGANAGAQGVGYNFTTGEECHPFPDPRYCDLMLLRVDLPSSDYWVTRGGGVQVKLFDYTVAASDFDLQIFRSDAAGTKGPLVGTAAANPGVEENFTIANAEGYYLIQVVYFASVGSYTGELKFVDRNRTAPDVDDPPGLQESLASNPALGFRSQSEPHIAQSPLNPDVLVAGSKRYNRDVDSLPEYEFKIGTYVSFDRGTTWTDLGQLGICPPDQAPPSSWPNNTCYPDEDPARDGTGAEDTSPAPAVQVDAAPGGAQVTAGERIAGQEFSNTRPLRDGSVGSYPVFLADDVDGCDWRTAVASGRADWIGIARRGGVCSPFNAKFTAASAAGADGVILVNTDDNVPATPQPTAVAAIPALFVKKSDGDRLISALDAANPDAVKTTMGLFPTRTLRGGGGDSGEEYITSDVWHQFDDEGNAYTMVLDAPPFASGAGWGMSLHKWASVSAADLATGQTWGPRIPISKHDTSAEQRLFLDDKNTFAINNAGPDNDGKTGIMVACWGKNVQAAIKQAIVCRRSEDGGATWPATSERVLNDAEQLAIGVHVVADPNDEKRFYAVWLQYATALAGAPDTMQFTQSLDGGLTWLQPSIPIATLDAIPRQFPGQSFRNLSIPIMAVGPASELYVTYADYRDAPDPDADADGKQADIVLVKSDLMGLTWSEPVKVNQEVSNADQFQPYVVVAPNGDVIDTYFDRRHDPDNFYIDTYMSRSSDGGETFTDTRLSHDASDPSINPPISTSGDFFGDYQGLVADECFAIPFVQDTHLANDPARDPEFDEGVPRSQFQEVFSWQVPIAPCGVAVFARVNGGGEVAGSSGGVASFGVNAREDEKGASGRVHVVDEAAGREIRTTLVTSVTRIGQTATIRGRCSVNGGAPQACAFTAVDGAPDEFKGSVGTISFGGALMKGNVHVR